MRFDVITLFPELFVPHLEVGVTRRAYASGALQLQLWPLRDFAEGNYRRVDDRPFGGGPGMVMMAPPLERALDAVRDARGEGAEPGAACAPLIHFSPTGRRLDQALVRELAAGPGAVLLCGRYEGIDQRFIDRHVDLELSVGDFVLSGGELPALVLLDAVARLLPGVLQDAASHQQDSFEDGLLDCPHYSRPEQLPRADGGFDAVPEVLLSGHHGRIARWRRERSLAITAQRRPDLIAAARAAGRLSRADEEFLRTLPAAPAA
ncbi:tRNA (guanosine(37)-N1)-methyltransferase TrmD [Azohydromonas aeria]|uniref:tRNA (guanosine(37)-N1)-methyltransferase TrmD n=1 Tax=Azohydromonas aeria TaxID=2590212 RepID=UPI0012F76A34|nr:tRNA (guanosine(37)-N1)-methyltransferase TrmD [Azohydromonas aeria]